jgi:hypothetical protein
MSLIHCGISHHPARDSNTSCDYCAFTQSKAAVAKTLTTSNTAIECEQIPQGQRILKQADVKVGDRVSFGYLGRTVLGKILHRWTNSVLIILDDPNAIVVDSHSHRRRFYKKSLWGL